MPAINLDFTDDDYELVRSAAEREHRSLKSFARSAVLAQTTPSPTTWTLVATEAEGIDGISEAAEALIKKRRGRSPEDGTYRANGCLWLHLTEPAAVIAYPTAHYTSRGGYEFVLDRHGVATVLWEWSAVEGLTWSAGEAGGQNAARDRAIAIGNRRLGFS
jgi:hypothetical protein